MGLFPRTIDFFKFFELQAEQLEAAAKIIDQIDSGSNMKKESSKMKKVEHAADNITHEIFSSLNQTFITPLDREDITSLAGHMDDVIDELDRSINRLSIYKIDPIPREINQYFQLISRSIFEISKAIKELRHHKNRAKLLKHCEITNFIENEADELHRITLARLFEDEKDAIKIIKLKEIYDSLENVTDRAEDAANVLEAIVIKNS